MSRVLVILHILLHLILTITLLVQYNALPSHYKDEETEDERLTNHSGHVATRAQNDESKQ